MTVSSPKEKKQLATVVHKYRPHNAKRSLASERFETETKSQRSLGESSHEKEKLMVLKTVLQEKREKPVIQLKPTTLVGTKSPHALSPMGVQQVEVVQKPQK